MHLIHVRLSASVVSFDFKIVKERERNQEKDASGTRNRTRISAAESGRAGISSLKQLFSVIYNLYDENV